ncbi:hypothetical protein GCK32_009059, partial [Trichostrongylus colubriformis]
FYNACIPGHIENAIKEVPKKRWGFRRCAINPSVLYRAELYGGKGCADPDADFVLLDRVVYTLQGTSIPFGSQGTVVGLSSGKVDVLFDHEFNSGYKIRGTRNSGACVPKTSLINITYGKSRKGKSTEQAEILKRCREGRYSRAKEGKRSTAGKENIVSVKQKVGLLGAHSSVTEQGLPIAKQLQKIILSKANNTTPLTSRAEANPVALQSPLVQPKAISKELVENELTSILGIRSSKNMSASAEVEKETPAVLKLFATPPEKACNDIKLVPQQSSSHPSAFTKLFPANHQNQNENCSNAFSALKVQQTPTGNAPFPVDFGNLLLRRGNVPYRGMQRRKAPAIQRNFVPTPVVPCPIPVNGHFFGPHAQQTPNDPKLTDLKPSSVTLPNKKPRRPVL